MFAGSMDMFGAMDDEHGRTAQLHLMNRTMNLPFNMMNQGGQIDASMLFGADTNAAGLLGGQPTLEQALIMQNMLASSGTAQSNNAAVLNAVAMANEILRRNVTQPMPANPMSVQQLAAAAATLAQQQAMVQQLTNSQLAQGEGQVNFVGKDSYTLAPSAEMAFSTMQYVDNGMLSECYNASWSTSNIATAATNAQGVSKSNSNEGSEFALPDSIYDYLNVPQSSQDGSNDNNWSNTTYNTFSRPSWALENDSAR